MSSQSSNVFLRASVALAFKAGDGPEFGDFGNKWGSGFNAQLEIGWAGNEALADRRQQHFEELVKMLDHRHLGFDAPELGISTPETLLEFCFRFLNKQGVAPVSVRLIRGEDIEYKLLGTPGDL